MPKRKTSAEPAVEPAQVLEPKAKKTRGNTKSTAAAATHKRASKQGSTPQVSSGETASVAQAGQATVRVRIMPTHEAIALRAYQLWQARGCQGGSAEQDWLQAERELLELP